MGTNGLDPIAQLAERKKCPDSPTKKKYRLSEEAWEAAHERSRETGLDIIAYACPGCGEFHLSKKVAGSDVVVAAPVGITTGALRRKSRSFHPLPERVELPPEGPIMPGNQEAKRRMLADFLESRDTVTTTEVMDAIGVGRHSVAKYMAEAGFRAGRGPGAVWSRTPKLEALDGGVSPLEAAIARHPSSQLGAAEWWTIEAFPPGVSVHDYLLTLKTAGLVVEVRVRRAP